MIERTSGSASLSAEVRRLYHVLLRIVADQGQDVTTRSFPDFSDAHTGGNIEAFGALVDAGLIEHDAETGLVVTMLPFVTQRPSTLVYLDANIRLPRYAASVLDAFALTPLLGRRVRVHDWCPTCGEPVQVLFDPERIRRREPRSAVVVRFPFDSSRQGRYDSARLTCSPAHAQAALEASGNRDAVMQSIEGVAIEARERYAALLER